MSNPHPTNPEEEALSEAYNMGLDYAKNGANESNCHFGIFSSKEKTKEWERGVDDFRGRTTN